MKQQDISGSFAVKRHILHIAVEYGSAILGGLGSVATQMVAAQNQFPNDSANEFVASIITPFYPKLYSHSLQFCAQVSHLYNHTNVKSEIYMCSSISGVHYMVKPDVKFQSIFNIDYVGALYSDTYSSRFIERLKYFNSAVASFINQHHFDILLLHDWQASLVPKLLNDVYKSENIKSIFIIHIDNYDYGGYSSEDLQGIGLNFKPGVQMLKAIGYKESDKIVAVSESFMKECMTAVSADRNVDVLRKILVKAATSDKKVLGILNGFNYEQYSPIGKVLADPNDIVASKNKLKLNLINNLREWFSNWHINPKLPLIFYIGRYSPEKGVDRFSAVINALKNRAIFFALGRGMLDSIQQLIHTHSRKTNNVFISADEDDQNRYGTLMRACADFYLIPSRRESCGLVSREGFANGSPCITTGVGGLRDSVSPLEYSDKNNTKGNAFIYEEGAEAIAVDKALSLWEGLADRQKNMLHLRLMDEAKRFDWLAPEGAMSKYVEVYEELLARPR